MTDFAVLQDRANRAILQRLGNAMAQLGAAEFRVLFDAAYTSVLDGLVESTGPAATGPTSALASAVQGTALTINGTAYLVTRNQPDGTGITTLLLERAA